MTAVLKFAFACFLLLLFFIVFGLPSLEKFNAKKTIVIESTKDYEETDHPAITVCANNGVFGWRQNGSNLENDKVFQTICNSSTNAAEALECINKNTFNLSEMVITTEDENQNILNESHWKEDISYFMAGKCQTLKASSVNIGTNMDNPLKVIYDKSQLQYTIIHDPNFFILGSNPETMPRITTQQIPSFGTQMMYMKTIEHVKMNLPNKPCEDSPSYSLTGCIRNSFSQKIGCRPEWDRWSDQERQVCTEMEQLKKIEKKFYELSNLEEMDITDHTGCLLPCRYKEYQIVDDPITVDNENCKILFVRATKTVLVKTEELVYPFSSFLAEFGGALGLFLGFSFMILWDLLQIALNVISNKKRFLT